MQAVSCVLILVAVALASAAPAFTPAPVPTDYEQLADLWYLTQYADEVNAALQVVDKLESTTSGSAFNCDPALGVSATVPTSVHALRPGDIKVVAALGDSITAAFGAEATSPLNLFNEWRGISWSIGGDGDVESRVTLPNIFKKFNPELKGASLAKGGPSSRTAYLNVAISGAIARGMPGQAETLVAKLKADTSINYVDDWKHITLWIGGNDLCAVCRGNPENVPAQYGAYLEEALDILSNIPRTIVSLVSIIDVTKLYDLHEGSCDSYHSVVCPCGTSPDESVRAATKEAYEQYTTITAEIAAKAKFNTRDDFTVVLQPFFYFTDIPLRPDGTLDRSYFAPDCFHFTSPAHEAAALSLWNNLLEPVGKKRTSWHLGLPLECPTASRPFIATSKNSVAASTSKVSAVASDSDYAVTAAPKPAEKSPASPAAVIGAVFGVLAVVGVIVGVAFYRNKKSDYTLIQ